MAAIAERKHGDSFSTGSNNTGKLAYQVRGATTLAEAKAAIAAVAAINMTVNSVDYVLDGVQCDEGEGGFLWNGSANYVWAGGAALASKTPGDSTFAFDTGGGSSHVLQAICHISSTKCAGAVVDPPDTGGAIGVTGDGQVMGCDIPARSFKFSVSKVLSPEDITSAWLDAIYKGSGTVNNNDVTVGVMLEGNVVGLKFLAGELLFSGASGTIRATGNSEIVFRMEGSPNVADVCKDWPVSSKPAAAVPKKGWEYAWIMYYEVAYASEYCLAKTPKAIYVDQVIPTCDFELLNLPTTMPPPPPKPKTP